MKIELLYFDGCPGYRKAERALRNALSGSGVRAKVETVLVNTDEAAERLRFPAARPSAWTAKTCSPKASGRGLAGTSDAGSTGRRKAQRTTRRRR